MSTQTPFICPVKSTAFGFLGVTMMMVVFAATKKLGIIDSETAGRAIGLAIGLMIVMIGNVTPKLRPLNWMRINARSTTAERLSGLVLVLAGISWMVIFTLAPIHQAKYLSALIGLGSLVALATIAVSWAWVTRGSSRYVQQDNQSVRPNKRTIEKRKITAYLFFAFLYVVTTACIKYLVTDSHFFSTATYWVFMAFTSGYVVIFALLESWYARKHRDYFNCSDK